MTDVYAKFVTNLQNPVIPGFAGLSWALWERACSRRRRHIQYRCTL